MVKSTIIRDGALEDKENLINDVAKAFDGGLYNDVSLVSSDNVIVSTNKFMLACRVPYFSSMLFGGFVESSSGHSVSLKCCDSYVFKQILKFVFKGSISFSGMTLQSLLNLLEISRFFCVEALRDGIIDYFQCLLEERKIDFKDCLVAFKFSNSHKFTRASGLFLNFIVKNLAAISSLSEFGELSESYLKMVMVSKEETSEIDRFNAYVKWLNCQEDGSVSEDFKRELLGLFDLRSFDRVDLVGVVGKSKLFSPDEIFHVLNERLIDLEKQKSKATWTVRLSEYYEGETLELEERKVFSLPSNFHSTKFNHMEFLIVHLIDCCEENGDVCETNCGFKYSYDVEYSEDGYDWYSILTC